jgi:hypothetical protein
MQAYRQLTGAVFLCLLSGCASITKDSNQPVKIETYTKDNVMVENARCTAINERGEWTANTPGTLVVHRSGQNLEVRCEREGNDTGHATLISRANGSMFGNILFGGGIGAIIDHNKGTAYSYPDWVRVIFGESLVFDRKHNKDNEVMIGQPASPEDLKKIQEAKLTEEKEAQEKAEQLAKKQADTENTK